MSEKQDIIGKTEHADGYRAKLANPDICMYIAVGDFGEKLGIVRFGKSNNNCAHVSKNESPKGQEKWLGKRVLRAAVDKYLDDNPHVKVLETAA